MPLRRPQWYPKPTVEFPGAWDAVSTRTASIANGGSFVTTSYALLTPSVLWSTIGRDGRPRSGLRGTSQDPCFRKCADQLRTGIPSLTGGPVPEGESGSSPTRCHAGTGPPPPRTRYAALRGRASIRAARPRCRPRLGPELLGTEIGNDIDDPCRCLSQPEGQSIDPPNGFDSDPDSDFDGRECLPSLSLWAARRATRVMVAPSRPDPPIRSRSSRRLTRSHSR